MAFAPGNSYASTKRSIPGSWGAFGGKASAALTTALAGTHNDLTYTAKAGLSRYATGNTVSVRYVVAGASTALSVSVAGSAITVNVATTSGSVASSTAAQVKAAVDAHAAASALVAVDLAAGNDGTGVVAALAVTNLAGGRDYVIGTGR